MSGTMTHTLVVAGFGGQGVLSLGMTVARAGLAAGYEVSWLPSYGPEQRGGTAHCEVVISEESIPLPMVSHPQTLIVLNLPSLRKFADKVMPGGTLICESGLESFVTRDDLLIVPVDSMGTAAELGHARIANMVLLGVFVGLTRLFDEDEVSEALAKVLPVRHHDLLPMNMAAVQRGMAIGQSVRR